MNDRMYSVEEVADLLGLHVRTVRGYIRAGRLDAVRIGKQYRISAAALRELTGRPSPAGGAAGAGGRARAEASSIVQIDGIGRGAADRLATVVLAGVNAGGDPASPLRVQTVHDPDLSRMKIVILGGAAATADVLRLIDGVLESVLEAGAAGGREDGDG